MNSVHKNMGFLINAQLLAKMIETFCAEYMEGLKILKLNGKQQVMKVIKK
jgi:hypothetical protein